MKNVINLFIYEDNNESLKVESFFTNYRKEKINETSNELVIKDNIITEHLLYNALKFMNINLYNLTILKSKNGKPYFKDHNINFNISHSNNLYIVAISNNNVGVDVEKINIKKIKIKDKLYEDPNENNSIDNIIKDFTIKESYIKYYGLTILHNLKNISINQSTVKGNNGTLKYETFKYKDFYITVTSKNDFEIKKNIFNQLTTE